MTRTYRRSSNGRFAGGAGGSSGGGSRAAKKVARLKKDAQLKTSAFRAAQTNMQKHTFATTDGGAVVASGHRRQVVKSYKSAIKAGKKYDKANGKLQRKLARSRKRLNS